MARGLCPLRTKDNLTQRRQDAKEFRQGEWAQMPVPKSLRRKMGQKNWGQKNVTTNIDIDCG